MSQTCVKPSRLPSKTHRRENGQIANVSWQLRPTKLDSPRGIATFLCAEASARIHPRAEAFARGPRAEIFAPRPLRGDPRTRGDTPARRPLRGDTPARGPLRGETPARRPFARGPPRGDTPARRPLRGDTPARRPPRGDFSAEAPARRPRAKITGGDRARQRGMGIWGIGEGGGGL